MENISFFYNIKAKRHAEKIKTVKEKMEKERNVGEKPILK